MLVALSVMEQRYHAVMKAVSGAPVAEVARRYGASCHADQGADLPDARVASAVGAAAAAVRAGQGEGGPLPSRSAIYRVLVRHGLVPARKRVGARTTSAGSGVSRSSCSSWMSPGRCSWPMAPPGRAPGGRAGHPGVRGTRRCPGRSHLHPGRPLHPAEAAAVTQAATVTLDAAARRGRTAGRVGAGPVWPRSSASRSSAAPSWSPCWRARRASRCPPWSRASRGYGTTLGGGAAGKAAATAPNSTTPASSPPDSASPSATPTVTTTG